MLKITVSVNDSIVAEADVANVSDLKSVSDYEVRAVETSNHKMGIPASDVIGKIEGHRRHASAWYLVEKVARLAIDEGQREAAIRLLYGVADVSDVKD